MDKGNIRVYRAGDANFICDVCGRKRKRSEGTLAYASGDVAVIMACLDGCADYRHPLNSPPPIIFDGQPIPDARPDGAQNQNSGAYFVSVFVPSLMKWGKFPGTGGWGKLNFGNKDENFNTQWTWGYFSRP